MKPLPRLIPFMLIAACGPHGYAIRTETMRWAPHSEEQYESVASVTDEVRSGLLAVGCMLRRAGVQGLQREARVLATCGGNDALRVVVTPRRGGVSGAGGTSTLTYMVQIDAESHASAGDGRVRAVEPSERARALADALYRWLRSPDRVR